MPMTLKERLTEDLKSAMKTGDSFRAGLLRMLLAEIHNKEIAVRSTRPEGLGDEDIMDVLRKEAKKRDEAAVLYKKGAREDLSAQEEKEAVHVRAYLPKELDRAEIEKIVEELVKSGGKEFSQLMKETMARVKGRADGRVVSEVVKEKLGS